MSFGESRKEFVSILLGANADPHVTARNGDTPLHMASYKVHTTCMRGTELETLPSTCYLHGRHIAMFMAHTCLCL